MPNTKEIAIERFLKILGRVELNDQDRCWLWPGESLKRYGVITVNGRHFRVHRLSFELWKGCIPRGLLVMHTCDVPRCCNPGHLFLGTHEDNMQDMIRKGRANFQKRGPQRDSDGRILAKLPGTGGRNNFRPL